MVSDLTPRLAIMDGGSDSGFIDAFVAAHPAATVFHTRQWNEAVAAGSGQTCLWLIARDGVLPLTLIHSPFFGRALVSSGFGVGGGILAGDADAAETLADAACRLARRLNCGSIALRGGDLPEGWARDEHSYLGFARPLAADDASELQAIPRKQRAEVRRAMTFGLTVDFGDADAHYSVYAQSVHALGTPVFPRALFRAVLDGFGDQAEILTVRRDGIPLASVLSLYHRGTVLPYWGGGTAAARTWRANDWMYYSLMIHARTRGARRFDFGRSKAGTGPAAFKRNWGFEARPLVYAHWSPSGQVQALNPLDPRFARKVRIWQRLPLPVANRLGPWIARGLG